MPPACRCDCGGRFGCPDSIRLRKSNIPINDSRASVCGIAGELKEPERTMKNELGGAADCPDFMPRTKRVHQGLYATVASGSLWLVMADRYGSV